MERGMERGTDVNVLISLRSVEIPAHARAQCSRTFFAEFEVQYKLKYEGH